MALEAVGQMRSEEDTLPMMGFDPEPNTTAALCQVCSGAALAATVVNPVTELANVDAACSGSCTSTLSITAISKDAYVPHIKFPVPNPPAQILLSALALVEIHNGSIVSWADPRLVGLNGGPGSVYATAVAQLANPAIAVVVTPPASSGRVLLAQLAKQLGAVEAFAVAPGAAVANSDLDAANAVFLASDDATITFVSSQMTRVFDSPVDVVLMPHLHDQAGTPIEFDRAAVESADLELISSMAPESLVWDGSRWPLVVAEWVIMADGASAVLDPSSPGATDCDGWAGLTRDMYYLVDDVNVQQLLLSTQGLLLASVSNRVKLREKIIVAECQDARVLHAPRVVFGAGASFPKELYSVWMVAYKFYDASSPTLEYSAVGSGSGKAAIVDGHVVFAGSDSIISDAQLAERPDLVMLPSAVGAVVTPVNVALLPGAPQVPLVLSREALVGIFLGQITTWNHPVIRAVNPLLASFLPSATIVLVVRSDKSGTTSIFTSALASFSPDWSTIGPGVTSLTSQWPSGALVRQGNSGVALGVLETPNSIGYVVLDVAIQYKLSVPNMINRAGAQVAPTVSSLSAATTGVSDLDPINPNVPFFKSLVDRPVPGAWPLAGFTFLVVPSTSSTECTSLKSVLNYYSWTLTSSTAAGLASGLGFSPITDSVLQERVLTVVEGITCDRLRLLSPCPPGEELDTERHVCVSCRNGTYASLATGYVCTPCPVGWFAPEGAVECSICPVNTYTSNTGGSCMTCPVGSAAFQAGSASIAQCECIPGMWRSPDADTLVNATVEENSDVVSLLNDDGGALELCLTCPAFSTCLGGDAAPQTHPGYWSSEDSPRQVYKCTPSAACLGGSQCRAGHTGIQCATCEPGYYAVDSLCTACPGHVSQRITLLIIVMIVIMVIPALTPQHRLMTMQVAPIVANYAQILAGVSALELGWPTRLVVLMRLLSPLHWVNIAAPPECAIDNSFYLSWGLRVMLPLMMFAFVALALALALGLRGVAWVMHSCACVRHGSRLRLVLARILAFTQPQSLRRNLAVMTTAAAVSFAVFFSQVPLEYFNCFEASDGKWYLHAAPSEQCYVGTWSRLLPLAIVVVLTHLVLFPGIVLVALYKARFETVRDRIGFQAFFGFLYLRYRPRVWAWEVAVFARKIATYCTVLFLFSTPMLAASLTLCIQAVYLVAHVSYVPYIMPGTNMVETVLGTVVVAVLALGQLFDSSDRVSRPGLTWALGLLIASTYLFLGFLFLVESLRAWEWLRMRFYGILTRPWTFMRSPTAHTRLIFHRHPNPLINSRVVHSRELLPTVSTFLEIRDPEIAFDDVVSPELAMNLRAESEGMNRDAALTANLLAIHSSVLNLFDVHGSVPAVGHKPLATIQSLHGSSKSSGSSVVAAGVTQLDASLAAVFDAPSNDNDSGAGAGLSDWGRCSTSNLKPADLSKPFPKRKRPDGVSSAQSLTRALNSGSANAASGLSPLAIQTRVLPAASSPALGDNIQDPHSLFVPPPPNALTPTVLLNPGSSSSLSTELESTVSGDSSSLDTENLGSSTGTMPGTIELPLITQGTLMGAICRENAVHNEW